MAKAYLKLKDPNTSFHDPQQGRGVSGKNIGYLHLTDRVKAGLLGGALIKLEEAEGKKLFDEQEALKAAEVEKKAAMKAAVDIRTAEDVEKRKAELSKAVAETLKTAEAEKEKEKGKK